MQYIKKNISVKYINNLEFHVTGLQLLKSTLLDTIMQFEVGGHGICEEQKERKIYFY